MCYRASQSLIPETSALTSVPCGIGMVLHECQPDIVISPQSCLHFKDWATGSFCHLSLSGPHPQESSFKPRNIDSLERRNSTSIKS
ncbi:unnamed protein product [Sphagnum jensenii]|uniref:Uncharacterized protein n=1 Tax=Sphagnum jensenii TaxID=128206 RepID=A0ABP1A4B6_9BRYO